MNIQTLIEMIHYEGYTYDELCAAAGGGGGGKSGGQATQQAPIMMTTTTLGDDLEVGVKELDNTDVVKESDLNIKKKGTRGLPIPLNSSASTPSATPASTGVQV